MRAYPVRRREGENYRDIASGKKDDIDSLVSNLIQINIDKDFHDIKTLSELDGLIETLRGFDINVVKGFYNNRACIEQTRVRGKIATILGTFGFFLPSIANKYLNGSFSIEGIPSPWLPYAIILYLFSAISVISGIIIIAGASGDATVDSELQHLVDIDSNLDLDDACEKCIAIINKTLHVVESKPKDPQFLSLFQELNKLKENLLTRDHF